jgi:hypothetical protein
MNRYEEKDILDQMDPGLQERVKSELSKYAPFLGMLAAWKGAVEEHVAEVESRTLSRLMEQFFPVGEWRFPAQTIAVPRELGYREITMETDFTDPLTNLTWTPCGRGWTLPSEITEWSVEQVAAECFALVLSIRYEGQEPALSYLTSEQGQLAFVWGEETLVDALANAQWAIRYPGQSPKPIGVERYTGYLEFEREMGIARLSQRQLEPWLPPFYPYSRKFLHFFYSSPDTTTSRVPEWICKNHYDQICLVALIDRNTAARLAAMGEQCPLVLNAIPVVQMAVLTQPVVAPLQMVGDAYKINFAGLTNFFAAIARTGNTIHRVRCERTPVDIPEGSRVVEQNMYHVGVICDQTATEVKVYFGCLGADVRVGEYLLRPGGQRFDVPLPPMGAMNFSLTKASDEGSRYYWYHTLLRPPLLTEGDIMEILSHLPSCREWFDLSRTSIHLDVAMEPRQALSIWETYLYPSLITESNLLMQRIDSFATAHIALVPVMRLRFSPQRKDLPAFLLADAASHAASVVSQYFMIGWYRVEGCLTEAAL